jgi:uncharacterized protein
MPIRRIVLDVLMSHEPGIVTYAEKLSELEGTDGVTVDVVEEDEQTKTVEVTFEGENLSIDAIRAVIQELGGAVHSVDLVSAGDRIVEPQGSPAEQE